MKKNLSNLLIAVLIIIVFQTACKKTDADMFSVSVESFKTITLDWIKVQKLQVRNGSFIDSMQKNADWDRISISKINSHESLAYVPFLYKNKLAGITFIVDHNRMEVEQGYVVDLLQQSPVKADPAVIMQKFYSYGDMGFSGAIAAYSLDNKFKWEMGYKGGSNVYRKGIVNALDLFNNGRSLVNTRRPGSANPSGNSCVEYYLVTYYNDGSTDRQYLGAICGSDCEMTRTMNDLPGIYARDCGSGGGGAGGGPENVTSVDSVRNDITTPCLTTVFGTLAGSGLKSDLATIFVNNFAISDNIDYFINEATITPDPKASANTVGQKAGEYTKIITTLNQTKLANASKEYIAETMFHEIIHGVLMVNTNLIGTLSQHTEMISSYVDCELAALQEVFPSLTNHDGLCLIMGGMGDVQQYDPATLNRVLAHYKLDINDVAQTNNDFQNGNRGHRCNPTQKQV